MMAHNILASHMVEMEGFDWFAGSHMVKMEIYDKLAANHLIGKSHG